MKIFQWNWQQNMGGGEVYTRFFTEALRNHFIDTEIWTNPKAHYWDSLFSNSGQTIRPIRSFEHARSQLRDSSAKVNVILGHGPLPKPLIEIGRELGAKVVAIAHMPPQGRRLGAYQNHDLVIGVSKWVLSGLLAEGLPCWSEPLYAIADLKPRAQSFSLEKTSRYAWDKRKFRDRLLGVIESYLPSRKVTYKKQDGLTLGIVSSITPIKQFHVLFKYISPIIRERPNVYIDIFGAGGYASIKALNNALQPCIRQVRFWGHQADVKPAYECIDYLLTGLPEKEALGLNVIEAQLCGVPVLAINAPPFTETILDGKTGFLYSDPRKDQGKSFENLLDGLQKKDIRLNPQLEKDFLQKFSKQAFSLRLKPLLDALQFLEFHSKHQ